MTTLSLNTRNMLALDPALKTLLGRSATFDTWIFDQKPLVLLENTQRVLLVINENGTHDVMNAHNTMRFPRLQVDVWADPTRNSDLSVKFEDADEKIEAVSRVLDNHLHTTNLDVPPGLPAVYGKPGSPRVWGTAKQIADRTGTTVLGSRRLPGPPIVDVSDGNGARMGTFYYGVNTY